VKKKGYSQLKAMESSQCWWVARQENDCETLGSLLICGAHLEIFGGLVLAEADAVGMEHGAVAFRTCI